MFWILFYDYVDDYIERRAPVREEHLSKAGAFAERGELVMAGAFGDDPPGAALVFKLDDKQAIEDFVRDDPYVKTGVVTGWRIRPWTVVVGAN